MAFIVKKTIKEKEYYYLNENKRVGGKVKTKTLAYLGKNKKEAKKKAGEIIKKMEFEKVEKGRRDNLENNRGRDKNEKGAVEITYFVHGTTTDNEKGISTGQEQGELSSLGIKQSKELVKQIENKEFDVIFCSDLKRAVDSAGISFGDKYAIIHDKRLRECNYGDLNLSEEEKVVYSEHVYKPFPNGESLKDVEIRMANFLNFLYEQYNGKSVAIIAHKAPQLALDVLLNKKTWERAIEEDWRNKKEWRPGWKYFVNRKIDIFKGDKTNSKMENIKKETPKQISNLSVENSGKESKGVQSFITVVPNESKEFASFVQEGGFIWGPEPEIYGGLAGFYTYGPIGKLLKNKVENSIRSVFNSNGFRELEGPTVMPDSVWKASGHLGTFSDPVIKTKDGKESYRVDKLLEENGIEIKSLDKENLLELIKKHKIKAPNGKELGDTIDSYSLMMKTNVAGQEASLRPETATVTYLPFPRLWNYFRRKTPFAVYQIGKAYRNEISPRQNVMRGREFTQAEGQIFVDPMKKNDWPAFEEIKDEKLPFWNSDDQKNEKEPLMISVEKAFETGLVKSKAYAWCLWLAYNQFLKFGIPKERIRLRQHKDDEKAFYADDAWDIEVKLNSYGWFELCGVHDRTDYDLKQHSKESGTNLEAIRENGEKFIPHILEIAFGSDRPTYALIDLFYEKKSEEEGKTVFKVPYSMAPIDVSVFPLMKKPELVKVAREIKEILERSFIVDYDESGSIGRRYLRSALVGTPFAITIDYESLEKHDVTIRSRDTEKQIRIKISELKDTLRKLIEKETIFDTL